MAHFRITGQQSLRGTLIIAGRKNAALKLIAATILSDQPITLHRVPDIGDVRVMFEIIRQMGGTVEQKEVGTYTVNTSQITTPIIPDKLGAKLRASLVLVGPLLARFKEVTFPHPGGDVIGKRSLDAHFEAFKELGAEINLDDESYTIRADELKGKDIYLRERSVTATENVLMAATRAQGTTTIYNAAEEPHISNLADLLRAMDYSVKGDGTSTITIEGNPAHTGTSAEATVLADDIEVGTMAVAAVVTKGEVTLQKVGTYRQLMPILAKLDSFNVQYKYNEAGEELLILPSYDLKPTTVQTNPWPGFPSDLQSPFTVLATQAKGTSLIHDWMYEGRLYFVDLLQKMGANVVICDPHRALVTGPTPLVRKSLISPDIRAGAALVIAALTAEGTSIIEHAEQIDRGYEKLDERLRLLGAEITREED